MLGIVIYGYGRMGHEIEQIINESDDLTVAGIVDVDREDSFSDADIMIEFSTAAGHDGALTYALEHNLPLVCGTTGLSDSQMEALEAASAGIPILYSSNFSYGVFAMRKLLALAASLLDQESWDAELVEAHHKMKLDAPSGTAKALIAELGGMNRMAGVHALRGGTEAGRHSVTFFGDNEQITIEHHAQSRRIFASGAVRAARLMPREPGMYSMEDI